MKPAAKHGGKSNAKVVARSVETKFQGCSDVPLTFPSVAEADAHAVLFRHHVEAVVQGVRPRITLDGRFRAPSPPALDDANRQKVKRTQR